MLTVAEIRRHFIETLNNALRRPGMYGGELGLGYMLERVVYVTETGDRRTFTKAFEDVGAWSSIGVVGSVHELLPGAGVDVTASVYADYVHRQGWLVFDRVLAEEEYSELRGRLVEYCAADHVEAEVLEQFGQPSVRIGGTNPRCESVLGYSTSDGPIVWFYLWNGSDPGEPDRLPLYDEPVLLAARSGMPFGESFVFTPEGERRRPQELGDPP